MDNVFIGSGTRILPNVRIGPNAIVAAGTLVTKDVPPGVVWGGVPGKCIGNFNDLMKKRIEESKYINKSRVQRIDSEWESFYKSRE